MINITPKKIVTAALVALCFSAYSQTVGPLSAELKALNPVSLFTPTGKDMVEQDVHKSSSQPSKIEFSIQPDGAPFLRAENFISGKTHFDVRALWTSNQPIEKGDVLLARFAIRTVYAKQESGDAVVYFYVNKTTPPNDRSIFIDINAGPEWKVMNIPFIASTDMLSGDASMAFTFGALRQKVEISGMQVLNFKQKTDISKLPITKLTYAGRENNAAWRKDALRRIDSLRTAFLKVKVVDVKGKPTSGAKVSAKMVQPEFIWGTAVNEAHLVHDSLPNAAIYRKTLKEFFSDAIIENGFKSQTWLTRPDRKEVALKAFDWLHENGFRQRVTTLIWLAWRFNGPIFKETALRDTAAFRKIFEADVRARMLAVKGRAKSWDVLNEFLHEKDFLPYVAKDALVQWFKMAKEIDPEAQLFINEYGMLNSILSPSKIRDYIEVITQLRKEGAPVEGIGIQGHVGRQPRFPVQVLHDLDMFKHLKIPVQITEFDVNTTDEELQADYTRDFLIACYSHPVITGFTKWGFWQGAHWKPDAAMFRRDWTPKPSAAVWREWVVGKWRTSFDATSASNGSVSRRGHFGVYEITVTKGGKVEKIKYTLSKDSRPVVVKL